MLLRSGRNYPRCPRKTRRDSQGSLSTASETVPERTIKDPFELIKRLPLELQREVIKHSLSQNNYVGDIHFQAGKWPHEFVRLWFRPFNGDRDLRKMAIEVWYGKARLILDDVFFERNFRSSQFGNSIAKFRRLIIELIPNIAEYRDSALRRSLGSHMFQGGRPISDTDIMRNQKFENYLLDEYSDLGTGNIAHLHTLCFSLYDLFPALGPVTEMIAINWKRFRPQKNVSIALTLCEHICYDPVVVSRYCDLVRGIDKLFRIKGECKLSKMVAVFTRPSRLKVYHREIIWEWSLEARKL